MKKGFFFSTLFFTFCGFAVLSVNAQAVAVTGSISKKSITRGSATKASVVLAIPSGLHVNSSRPSSEFSIPTTVSVSGSGVKTGGLTFPRGRNRKFQFSENQINVYEGRVTFPFTVTVPANFRGNTIRVNATVRYQACTEEVCYPPKSKTITMTAKVL
jgi:DsbC/DsbD-like thiol-disulfide interchange protein